MLLTNIELGPGRRVLKHLGLVRSNYWRMERRWRPRARRPHRISKSRLIGPIREPATPGRRECLGGESAQGFLGPYI